VPEATPYDVIVFGAGTAGCAAALQLARDRRRVLLIVSPRREAYAEVLPSTALAFFDRLGVREELENDGLHAVRRVSCWPAGGLAPNDGSGISVRRDRLDAVLLAAAERAGVDLARTSRAPMFDLAAGSVEFEGGVARGRFIAGGAGRSGLLARQLVRYWDPRYRTLALGALWRGSFGDSTTAVTEAFPGGWLSSAPVGSDSQYVYVIFDSEDVRQDPERAYRAAIERSSAFRGMLARATTAGPVSPEDATPYRAHRFASGQWILLGESGCCGDALTWGLEQALDSALAGVAIIEARLDDALPAEDAALLYDEYARRTYSDHIRRAAERYAAVAAHYGAPFWRKRSRPPEELLLPEGAKPSRAIEPVRRWRTIRIADGVRIEPRRWLTDGRIATIDAAEIPGLSPETEQVDGVSLPILAALARHERNPQALADRYQRTQACVSEAAVERALAILAGFGLLAPDA
jgi:flavin-dependent dehydrogenase